MLYDIIVVGAGPAGLPAGANASNRGLKTLILEGQGIPGGQPNQFYPNKLIIDHPGFPKGITAKSLSKRLYEQALHSKAEIRLNQPMIDMKLKGEVKKVITKTHEYQGKKVVLCTGLHNIPRHLPSLEDYKGKNVHYFVRRMNIFKHKRVLVVGGGDTAFDRALMLSKTAKHVTIILREHMAKAKEKTVKAAISRGVDVHYNTELVKMDDKTRTAVLKDNKGKQERLKIDKVVVSIGFVSSLDVLNRLGLEKDEHGMIKVNHRMETSIPGVFAAGDLVGDVKLIAVACSEAIIAAISTFNSIKKPYWL